MPDYLLTRGRGSPKISHGDLTKYEAAVLHLLPHREGLFKSTLCPWSTPGCRMSCLAYAGRGQADWIMYARYWKSKLYREDRKLFMRALTADLSRLAGRAAEYNRQAVVRLDGTSDLGLAQHFATLFPMILFYDYTKSSIRYMNWAIAGKHEQPNRYLTFSRSESNEADCLEILDHGGNVAVVFSNKKGDALPKKWKGWPVLDADKDDFRFLDPPAHVAGLRAKGRARHDASGFVVQV